MHTRVSILFWSGIVLGRARHRPRCALRVLGFYLGCALRYASVQFGSYLNQAARRLWCIGHRIDRPWTRNLGVLFGFGLLTELLVGGGAALWVLLFLIGVRPGSRGRSHGTSGHRLAPERQVLP